MCSSVVSKESWRIWNELGNPRGIKVTQVNGYIMMIESTRDGRKISKISDGSSGQTNFKTIESII